MTVNSSIQYLNPLSIEKIKISDPIYPFSRNLHGFYYSDGEELVYFMNSVEQWRIVVGPIRQIFSLENSVVVLGDNAIWDVADARINKTKVLEDDVSCGTIIPKKVDEYNILVGNFSNQVLVYDQNYTLIWAVKMEEVPLKICLLEQRSLKGALCILG